MIMNYFMNDLQPKPSIGILGLWHLGLVYSACLSKLGYSVTAFDFDKKLINNLNILKLPLYEPGLDDVISQHINRNLFFTNNPKNTIQNKNFIFICLDIPVNSNDELNLKLFDKIFDLILMYCSHSTIIVVSSQIPVGTSRILLRRLKSVHKSIELIYFPENIRLGEGLKSFLHPDRIILGSNTKSPTDILLKVFPIFNCKVIRMSYESAEMVKHALNSFLAINISFASEIGDICEFVGANLNDIRVALKTDKRISINAPINPGLGFSGGTLGRDIQLLRKLSYQHNYDAKLLKAAYEVNKDRLKFLLKKINKYYPSVNKKNIGILGLTYKPDTSSLRRSISLDLAKLLHRYGAKLRAFDPTIKNTIDRYPYIIIADSLIDFFQNLDMVILMTEWPEFQKIRIDTISKLMKNRIILDTKNFFDPNRFIPFGFIYSGIGFHL